MNVQHANRHRGVITQTESVQIRLHSVGNNVQACKTDSPLFAEPTVIDGIFEA